MKLIQVYNTFGGDKTKCGFTSFRALIDFWKKATEQHKINYDVTIYTDEEGYKLIKDEFDVNIEVIKFPYVDDRYYFIGKTQVLNMQTEPFIYVDTDVILYDAITEFNSDVIVENIRGGLYGKYLNIFNLSPLNNLGGIPNSGLLGFKDPAVSVKYSSIVLDKIRTASVREVTFEAMWHVEEVGLGNYIENNKLTTEIFENFVHLQGGLK